MNHNNLITNILIIHIKKANLQTERIFELSQMSQFVQNFFKNSRNVNNDNNVNCHDVDTDSVSTSATTESDVQLSISSECSSSKLKKSVNFSKIVTVVLIPTRNELSRFRNDLWFLKDEVKQFKTQAQVELFNFAISTGFSVEESLEALYQPSTFYIEKLVTIS